RQPRQGGPPRPHASPVTCAIPVKPFMVVSMSAIATTFSTGHVGLNVTALGSAFSTGHCELNVTDLERSLDSYTRVFGWSVRSRGDGYAFLGDDSRLIVTLWEQDAREFSPQAPGLHHLSFDA